jgi:hypothetical protein
MDDARREAFTIGTDKLLFADYCARYVASSRAGSR